MLAIARPRRCADVWVRPDGKRLATAGTDGTIQMYALDLGQLLRLARSRVTRPFIAQECQRYLQSATCPPLP
jgi:hypothetical protein